MKAQTRRPRFGYDVKLSPAGGSELDSLLSLNRVLAPCLPQILN